MLGWGERRLLKRAHLEQRSGGQLAEVEKSGVARRVTRWKGLLSSGGREEAALDGAAEFSRSDWLEGPTV